MKENQLTAFNFEDHAVRVVDIAGEPWFVASDIGVVLDITKVRNTIASFPDDEKGAQMMSTPGGDQKMLMVNESGLYRLIFASRKPQAEAVRKWVFAEVLPAIRKTGKFEVDYDGVVQAIERSTIPAYIADHGLLDFEDQIKFGWFVRNMNRSLGVSGEYTIHPKLGKLRNFSVEILNMAWIELQQWRRSRYCLSFTAILRAQEKKRSQ